MITFSYFQIRNMAALSHIKNRREAKLRENIEQVQKILFTNLLHR